MLEYAVVVEFGHVQAVHVCGLRRLKLLALPRVRCRLERRLLGVEGNMELCGGRRRRTKGKIQLQLNVSSHLIHINIFQFDLAVENARVLLQLLSERLYKGLERLVQRSPVFDGGDLLAGRL